MATNMKENGFETMIVKYLVENNHYEEGSNSDYNKIYAIDEVRLFRFLHDTQYEKLAELRIEDNEIEKKKFLDRLSKKISDDGVINIIRKGMKYKNKTVDFYMVRPSEGNQEAKESYDKNIFSVTRQLRYSNDYGRLALDVCIFLNGLPIITMELKNQITKQNHDDAIGQYMTDRTPDELLFQFKRCIVHFAVDDDEIYMCTELKKEKSFFMPFNKGNNNGAGNPRNPNGLKTDYLWKDILTKPCLSNILENYVQITEEKDEDTGRKSYKQIFPRYHQLSVVTSLLADAKNDGPGHRYLIQHSAGSGKSNSIAWLAHQLVTLKKDKKDVFDTVIVVTDRVNLDKQIRDTIKQFMQVSSTVGWAKDASTLSTLMEQGKKIIITIVHKFQFILDAVSADYKNKKFAIIIDEAHSSQNGSLAAKMNIAVSGNVYDDDDEFEDKLNTIIEGKKMAPNASYFAFTATPKNKTLEMFGKKMFDEHGNPILNDDGTQKANPHYVYTMKQAIEEKFILDVLRYYTPYESFYHIVKTVENDPLFDKKQAQRILRYYVEVQKVAVKELTKHDNGILHAATAFGKTVVCSAVIAEKKVNTLILLESSALIEQWKDALNKFLIIDEELPQYKTKTGRLRTRKSLIGTLQGAHDSMTGIIDIAMAGSLCKKGEYHKLLNHYGLVLIDECHHCASETIANVLKEVKARYVYGVTATPKRGDGLEKINYMLIGPIRYSYTAKEKAMEQGIQHLVYPRFTRTVPPRGVINGKMHPNEAYDIIHNNDIRDEQIIEDIKNCVSAGRTPVVLSRYKDHSEKLYKRLKDYADHVFLMTGNNSKKEHKKILEQMHQVDKAESLILIATGSLVGEGFDFPRLDTLFMATPVSFRGVVEQYAGRLNRDYAGKENVIIYDYVDNHITMFNNMYMKRLKAYKQIGYEIG